MLLLIKHSILRIGLASAGITIAACSVAPPNTAAVAPTAAPTAEASPLQAVSPSSTARGFKQATVAEGLERPWGMAWLPDGSMLISEKPLLLKHRPFKQYLQAARLGGSSKQRSRKG